MYYNFIHLKKKFPKLYNFAKQAKRKLYFDKNFVENLKVERLDLIKSIKTESYIDYKKKQYDKTKGTISKVGILEINNSCNINCVMCDTKSSTRQKC